MSDENGKDAGGQHEGHLTDEAPCQESGGGSISPQGNIETPGRTDDPPPKTAASGAQADAPGDQLEGNIETAGRSGEGQG